MSMKLKTYKIIAKNVLTKSKIPGVDYSLNPYIGCVFGCKYCYASFIKKFRPHEEPWGEFVEIKLNCSDVLKEELKKKKPGKIVMSLVCDPYQPIEEKYRITRKCLETFLEIGSKADKFNLSILTKSPLVIRDIDILKELKNVEVGFSIATDNEEIRKIFGPRSPTIKRRLEALKILKGSDIKTYAFVAPVLPMNVTNLMSQLHGLVDRIDVDCMNYVWKTRKLYERYKIEFALDNEYCENIKKKIYKIISRSGKIG